MIRFPFLPEVSADPWRIHSFVSWTFVLPSEAPLVLLQQVQNLELFSHKVTLDTIALVIRSLRKKADSILHETLVLVLGNRFSSWYTRCLNYHTPKVLNIYFRKWQFSNGWLPPSNFHFIDVKRSSSKLKILFELFQKW